MNQLKAEAWLTNELIKGGFASQGVTFFDQQGQAIYRAPEGINCLFWLRNTHWHLYSPLREIKPESDGRYLAVALSLNLQPREMQGTSIGLNLESRQLLLQQCTELSIGTLDVGKTLNQFIIRCQYLRERLETLWFPASNVSRKAGLERRLGQPPSLDQYYAELKKSRYEHSTSITAFQPIRQ
ncbi:MAG: CesT family type III secretion system chaperone [Exilibacterium sp.]